jgi:hypothetical protein
MARKTKKRIKKTAFRKKMGSGPKSVASASVLAQPEMDR